MSVVYPTKQLKLCRTVWKILEELKTQGLTIFLTFHFIDEDEVFFNTLSLV